MWQFRFKLALFVNNIINMFHKHIDQPTRVIALIKLIPEELFVTYNPKADYSKMLLSTYFGTMSQYGNSLKQICKFLESNTKVDKSLIPTDYISSTLDTFICVNNDGYYVDPIKTGATFKMQALRFCELMQLLSAEQVGVGGYNYRVCQKFLRDLEMISNTLLKSAM